MLSNLFGGGVQVEIDGLAEALTSTLQSPGVTSLAQRLLSMLDEQHMSAERGTTDGHSNDQAEDMEISAPEALLRSAGASSVDRATANPVQEVIRGISGDNSGGFAQIMRQMMQSPAIQSMAQARYSLLTYKLMSPVQFCKLSATNKR